MRDVKLSLLLNSEILLTLFLSLSHLQISPDLYHIPSLEPISHYIKVDDINVIYLFDSSSKIFRLS